MMRRRARLRHLGAASAAVGVLLAVSLFGASSARASHAGTAVGGNVAWCNLRVSSFGAGTTYSAWASCKAVGSQVFHATDPQTMKVELLCNGVSQGSELIGGRDISGAAGTKTVTFAGTPNRNLMRIEYQNWEWYNGCTNAETRYNPSDSGSLATFDVGGSSTQLFDNASSRTANHGLGLTSKVSGGSGFPAYPDGSGGSGVPANPTVTCEADLTAGDGIYRAKFNAQVTNAVAGAADTFAWTFGDGGTSTQEDPSHTYATADNAGAKWTATVTVTRANAESTAQCSLTFDFYGPGHVDGSTPGDGEDSSCDGSPAPWDVVGWLKKLFIPCGDGLGQTWTDVKTAAEDNWPFAPLLYVTGAVGDVGDTVSGAANGDVAGYADDVIDTSGVGNCTGLRIPMDFIEEGQDMIVMDQCESTTSDPTGLWGGVRDPLRAISRAVSVALAFTLGVSIIRNAAERGTQP